MQPRRLRPVAALTLALVAAPFLAATAVAAQGSPEPPAVTTVTWIGDTALSARLVLARIELATADPVAAPKAATVKAVAPPAPPPATDPATWVWPADGPITSPFGSRWGRKHEGVDIDAAYGSAVVAAQRGTVVAAGWGQSGYGRVVHIDHGSGLVSSYNHLASIEVSVGQLVERGVRVGTVGASGSVTAAHLHYEVRVDGVANNPVTWLTGTMIVAGNPG